MKKRKMVNGEKVGWGGGRMIAYEAGTDPDVK